MSTVARFQNVEAARARFGDRIDRLGASLLRTDPLADAAIESFASLGPGEGWSMFASAIARGIETVPGAPPALRALFEHIDRVPLWVDRAALDRGGALFLRSGLVGGLVLGAESLIFGYASPGGNKPLVFSGRLQQQASRRLGETGRFVHAVSRRGGLERFADGLAITVKVRLIHAQVRKLIGASGRWRADLWGAPINQHDMAATALLFSLVVLDGFETFGFRVEPREAEDLMHLWAYVAHLMGVEPDMIPRSLADARRLADMIRATQGPPDDDSRALVRALLESGVHAARSPAEKERMRKRLPFSYGLCRALLGDELADALAIPRNGWRFAVPAARSLLAVGTRVLGNLPFVEQVMVEMGERYWEQAVALSLRGEAVDYGPPAGLAAPLN